MRIVVYGSSDDLIEVEDGIVGEFNCYDEEDGRVLAFSDGTLLRMRYDEDGIWRATIVHRGSERVTKSEATGADDDYSDRVTLNGDFAWMVYGTQIVKPA